MIRLLIQPGLLLAALLTLPILLIRAQPYDSAPLRAFLFDADCSAPCFMGIRPGTSSADDVYRILREHAWVDSVLDYTQTADEVGRPGISGEITWRWSGAQPAWIDDSVQGRLRLQRDVVSWMNIRTRIALGDVRLLLAQPDWEQFVIERRTENDQTISYRGAYQRDGLLFQTASTRCPARGIWWQALTLAVWYDLTPSQPGLTVNINSGCQGIAPG